MGLQPERPSEPGPGQTPSPPLTCPEAPGTQGEEPQREMSLQKPRQPPGQCLRTVQPENGEHPGTISGSSARKAAVPSQQQRGPHGLQQKGVYSLGKGLHPSECLSSLLGHQESRRKLPDASVLGLA